VFDSFLRVSAQDAVAIYNSFTSDQDPDLGGVVDECERRRVICMISWATLATDTARPGSTSASVAAGDIDSYLLAQATGLRRATHPVFLRINYEMNAWWTNWGSFTADGEPRPGNSPTDYQQAWRRIRVLFRGGPATAIDRELAALNLPPLHAPDQEVAPTPAAFVWSPTSLGPNPPEAGGRELLTSDWYPGDAFVDWVGLSHYARGVPFGEAASRPQGLDDFYRDFAAGRSKPMIFSEWGVWDRGTGGTGDDPAWLRASMRWMLDHPLVKAQVYFNFKAADGEHRLEVFPESAVAYRKVMQDGVWLRDEIVIDASG
jgi:beta-mannanase